MIQIEIMTEEYVPLYATEGSAGADLKSMIRYKLDPGKRALIPTGIKLAIPVGYEVQIRPKSGLAIKHGITITNSPGTVDSDYRGEIKVMLQNTGDMPFVINKGDKIAQMVAAKVEAAMFVKVKELSNTERGTGGFGSTGI